MLSLNAHAQARDEYRFRILKGQVTVTQVFCFPRPCDVRTAELSGSFVGFLPGGGSQLFFPSSSVTTTPDVDFELPRDPNADSGGTVRDVQFRFDGSILKVSGTIDSRAFDGPLVEYEFAARVVPVRPEVINFTARPDFRECAFPLCGGYFVNAVNKKLTRCADGTYQEECYVAKIKFPGDLAAESSLRNRTPLFLIGRLSQGEYPIFGKLDVFEAKAAFKSATQRTARGRFYGVENNGLVCITTPCFSYDQTLLNTRRIDDISLINFNESGASRDKIATARKILASGRSLYASGRNREYEGLAGTGVEFMIHQFYLPIRPNISLCAEGYSYDDGACRTPYGCVFPELELTGYGGAPIVDPVTGEITAPTTKSCVASCDPPAFLESPAQCVVYYP